MISQATDNNMQRGNKPSEAMLKSIAQTISMFGGEESRVLFEKIHAKEIAVDYTAGLDGEQHSRSFMARWAAGLPGFDHTRYTISNVSLNLQIDGAQLTAEVQFEADRWADDFFLEIKRAYSYCVHSDLRPSQLLNQTLEVLSDTGTWSESSASLELTSKEIVQNFVGELRLANIARASQWIDEDAIFFVQSKIIQDDSLRGRREIVHFLTEVQKQQDSFIKLYGGNIYALEERGAFFIQWSGGAAHVVVKNQRITALQTYLC